MRTILTCPTAAALAVMRDIQRQNSKTMRGYGDRKEVERSPTTRKHKSEQEKTKSRQRGRKKDRRRRGGTQVTTVW